MTGEYWTAWKRSQPIQETAVVHLRWSAKGYEVVLEEDPLAEVMEFEVRDVDDECESYFDKDVEAVKQAAEQAVFKGYQSHQSEILKVDVPFDPNLRLGDFVRVQDYVGRISRLSGNEMVMNVWITLVKDYGFDADLGGLELKRVSGSDLEKDLVKSVHVENSAMEQREMLVAAQSVEELRSVLGSNKTRISLEFGDLKAPVERVYGVR